MKTHVSVLESVCRTKFALEFPNPNQLSLLATAEQRNIIARSGDKLVNAWIRKKIPQVLEGQSIAQHRNVVGRTIDRAQSNHYLCWVVHNHAALHHLVKKLEIPCHDVWHRATLFEALAGFIDTELGPLHLESFLSQTLLVPLIGDLSILSHGSAYEWMAAFWAPQPDSNPAVRIRTALKQRGVCTTNLDFYFHHIGRKRKPVILYAHADHGIVSVVKASNRSRAWVQMRMALASYYKVKI